MDTVNVDSQELPGFLMVWTNS